MKLHVYTPQVQVTTVLLTLNLTLAVESPNSRANGGHRDLSSFSVSSRPISVRIANSLSLPPLYPGVGFPLCAPPPDTPSS